MKVRVALALPRRQHVVEVALPAGATVADALSAARLGELVPGFDAAACAPGIWSRPCALDTPLRDGDRVELYRLLLVDPKQARRSRAKARPAKR